MRLRPATRILGGFACLFTCGCWPASFVDVPAFNGRLLDVHRRPIPNATITVVPHYYMPRDQPDRSFSILTSMNGDFASKEKSRFYFLTPVPIELEWNSRVDIMVRTSEGPIKIGELKSGSRGPFGIWYPQPKVNLGDVCANGERRITTRCSGPAPESGSLRPCGQLSLPAGPGH